MTATATAPTGASLTHVPIDAITVVDGFNPRTAMDDARLAEITASVKQVGIIQPVIVTPGESEGAYTLIAGHRRVAAARAAKLAEVPSLVFEQIDEQTKLQLALIENLQREDISPIDEAAGYERAINQFGLTQKQLAEMLGRSTSHVSERLRLRKLPAECQQHIASGAIPLTAVKSLAAIARTAPAVADACARLVATGETELDDLIEEPHYVVGQVAQVEWEGAPFVHPCRNYSGAIRLGGHIDKAELDALDERARALKVTRFAFTAEDLDAARAYQCLLELPSQYTTHCFVTDAQFTLDRLKLALDTAEAAQAAEIAADSPQNADAASDTDVPGDDKVVRAQRLEEKRKQAEQKTRAKEREQKEQNRLAAISANRQLGIALAKKLGSKTLDRDTAMLLARLVLHGNRDLAARGIRLTHEEYHQLEHTRQKNGKTRTTFTPIAGHEAREKFETWVLRPKQPDEIIGRLLQALVAGTFADQAAVTMAQITNWSAPMDTHPAIGKLAAKLLPEHLKPRLQRILPAKTQPKKRGKDAF